MKIFCCFMEVFIQEKIHFLLILAKFMEINEI